MKKENTPLDQAAQDTQEAAQTVAIKPGAKTSEFWLLMTLNALTAVMAFLETIDASWAIFGLSIANGIYVTVRGVLKRYELKAAAGVMLVALICGFGFTSCETLRAGSFSLSLPAQGVELGYSEKGGLVVTPSK